MKDEKRVRNMDNRRMIIRKWQEEEQEEKW